MKDIHIKVADQEHADFFEACKENERSATDVLRELMRAYVRKHKKSKENKT